MQLGGAAGTLAGYLEYARSERTERLAGTPAGERPGGAYVRELTARFAGETGLSVPALPWHSTRSPVATLGSELALVAGVLGKIAVDVQSLSRTETAEVAEPAATGRGRSSAMPHKRNPALAALIRSAALQVPAYASVLGQAMMSEDERSAGAWHPEWQPLRECLRLTGGAAATTAELTSGLTIHPARMRENLDLTGGGVVSERLAATLAPILGKVPAKELMNRVSHRASAEGTSLAEELATAPELRGRLGSQELSALVDPTEYTGAASDLAAYALAGYRHGAPGEAR